MNELFHESFMENWVFSSLKCALSPNKTLRDQMEYIMVGAVPLKIKGKNQMIFPNVMDVPDEDEEGIFSYPFLKWNCHNLITPLMIVYWLRCISKPRCCKDKDHFVYLWGPWMEIMKKNTQKKSYNPWSEHWSSLLKLTKLSMKLFLLISFVKCNLSWLLTFWHAAILSLLCFSRGSITNTEGDHTVKCRKGIFDPHMIKFSRYNNIVYCTDYSLGLTYYKNPSLKGDKYLCEIHDCNNVYINAILLDYSPTYKTILEEIAVFYLSQFYQPGHKTKWSCHQTQNTSCFLHVMKLSNRRFARDTILLTYNKNFILTVLQLCGKKSVLWNCLTKIQFDLQNIYAYIGTLSTSIINPKLNESPTFILSFIYDVVDKLRSHLKLGLPANIESDI